MYPTRVVSATALALLLSLGLMSGALAQGTDSLQPAPLFGQVRQAQDSGLVVTITQVDSEAFPQVTTYVAVSGEDGSPLQGLTADNFTLWEGGVEVSTASIAVEENSTQDFAMVLALDISTFSPENLDRVREAVKSFVETLRSQDRLAIVTFYDKVHVAQGFTSDKEDLNAIIGTLGPSGNYTALNDAIVQSVTLVGQFSAAPLRRKAVVVVTDSTDNVGNITIADAMSQVLDAAVPIYTIGFGSKIEPTELEEIARLTRGQSFILSGPGEVQDKLLEIEQLLRQGYRVTYQSGIQADNNEHELSVSIASQGIEGQALGHFEAVPNKVTVSLTGIVVGQKIAQGDVVTIAAQVAAPGRGVSVVYLLDGQPLAQRDAPPYSFKWDSTDVEPGAHVMSVRAVDSAGNEGQADIDVGVTLPLVVSLSTLHQEVKVGEIVTVEAQIDASAEVASVEFLVDGRSLGSVEALPYSFSLDSTIFGNGAHVVTARAEDSKGRMEQADLNLQFLAPPELPSEPEKPTFFRWSTILASAIVCVILALASAVLINLVRRRKTRYQRAYRLEISNQGNAPSRYELQAHDPAGIFEFEFALNGTGLQQRSVATEVDTFHALPLNTLSPLRGASHDVVMPASTIPSDSQSVPAASADDATPGQLASLRTAAGNAASASGALTSMLSTASALLPGSSGRTAQRATSRLRRGQTQTRRADQLVGRVTKAKSISVRAPTGVGLIPGDQSTLVTDATVESARRDGGISATEAASAGSSFSVGPQSVVHAWAQTPTVKPGETLAVTLLVNPIKSYRDQRYPLTLFSRSVEQNDAPLIAEEVGIQIARPSWLRRLYPYLAVVSIMAVTITLYIAFLINAGVLV